MFLKKYFPFICFSVCFLVILVISIIFSPYYYYEMMSKQNNWVKGKLSSIPISNTYLKFTQFYSFHLGDFKMVLPTIRTQFIIRPKLDYDNKNDQTQFGLKFTTNQNNLLVEIDFLNGNSIDFKILHSMFEYPVIKEYIEEVNTSLLWDDLFSLDLSVDNKKNLFKRSYFTIIYQLYILELRKKIFENNSVIKFSGLNSSPWKYVLIKSTPDEMIEEYWVLKGKRIEKFRIKFNPNDLLAIELKNAIVQTIRFEESSKYLAPKYYTEFKQLKDNSHLQGKENFDQQILLLISAFSQDIHDKKMILFIIDYLKVYDLNFVYLDVFINYFKDKYGQNALLDYEKLKEEERNEQVESKQDKSTITEELKMDPKTMLDKKIQEIEQEN